jgi:hypothetical protein
MDRIEPLGPRTPPWTTPLELDPDRDAEDRRRREAAERRRRERQAAERPQGPPQDGDEPPRRVDVRA